MSESPERKALRQLVDEFRDELGRLDTIVEAAARHLSALRGAHTRFEQKVNGLQKLTSEDRAYG